MIEENKKCVIPGCKNPGRFILPFFNGDSVERVCHAHYQEMINDMKIKKTKLTLIGIIKYKIKMIRQKIKDFIFEIWKSM